MDLKNNTILITGGATGIGFALAESLLKLGNKVIICGRREERLAEAKKKLPDIEVKRCDVSKAGERKLLVDWINSNYRETNILVNNAGIQRQVDFKKGAEDLMKSDDEIDINLKAQVYLSAQLVPMLMKRSESAIVNVSSGLGFVPLSRFPVYCATKAAIHSFTLSLRHQLRDTSVKVFEIIPPTVHDTGLKGKPIEKTDWSVSASEVASAAVKGIIEDQYEIAIGPSKAWVSGSREDLDKIFRNINR